MIKKYDKELGGDFELKGNVVDLKTVFSYPARGRVRSPKTRVSIRAIIWDCLGLKESVRANGQNISPDASL